LQRPGPFTDPDWLPGDPAITNLKNLKILVMFVHSICYLFDDSDIYAVVLADWAARYSKTWHSQASRTLM